MKIERIFIWILMGINFIFWALLVSGNFPLKGLRLTGAIKSTAPHCPNNYDNLFVAGLDKSGAIQGTGLRATNIRGSSITGWYILNEGQLTQHGGIVFAESIYLPPLRDKNGKIIKDKDGNIIKNRLAVPQFYASGRIGIHPDYINERIGLMGAYVDKDGIYNIAPQEIERIKKEISREINKDIDEKLSRGFVRCGK